MASAAQHSRNLWPVGIVAAFVIFVAGTVALIALASSNQPELVTRDYYEQEVRHQAQIDRLERTRRLQPPPAVAYDPAQQRISISLPPDHVRSDAKGRIHLYRPSAHGLDRRIELHLDANGCHTLEASGLLPGLWKVRVSWTVNGLEYHLDQSVIVD